MITREQVQRVAFTAQPYRVREGIELTIDDIIKLTTANDWDGDLYRLGDSAAEDIAAQFNATHHLTVTTSRKRVRAVGPRR